jgi:hypothetical protein
MAITVGDLRKIIDNYPDDYYVLTNNGLDQGQLCEITEQHMPGAWQGGAVDGVEPKENAVLLWNTLEPLSNLLPE